MSTATAMLSTYSKEILAFTATLAAWALNTYFKPRARLVQGVRHATAMLINESLSDEMGQSQTVSKLVRVAQVTFVNTGREAATDLQVTFNWRPQHLSVWPHRLYSEQLSPDERFTLLLGTLPPKETINIDLLSVESNLPEITSAHCNQCSAKQIPLQMQEVHPRWKLILVLYLMTIGFASSVYLFAATIQWIAAS